MPTQAELIDEAGRCLARLRALTPLVAERWEKLDNAMAATGRELTSLFKITDQLALGSAETPPKETPPNAA